LVVVTLCERNIEMGWQIMALLARTIQPDHIIALKMKRSVSHSPDWFYRTLRALLFWIHGCDEPT